MKILLVIVAAVGLFGGLMSAAASSGCHGVGGCHRPTPTATIAPTPIATPTPILTPTPVPTTYDGQYDAGAIDTEEAAFLVLINNYRAQNGLGALTLDTRGNAAADWKSNELGLLYDYFAHDEPPCPSIDPKCGESWTQVMCDFGYGVNDVGYCGGYLGQNLAGGFWSAQNAFDAWHASPGHDAIMLGTYYTTIGIGRVFVPGSYYGMYWTADFAG